MLGVINSYPMIIFCSKFYNYMLLVFQNRGYLRTFREDKSEDLRYQSVLNYVNIVFSSFGALHTYGLCNVYVRGSRKYIKRYLVI